MTNFQPKTKAPTLARPKPANPPKTCKIGEAKLTRIEKAELIREKILTAAAEVISEYGYQNASVGRIALAAGVAQGTIYIYFETRQHLFDEVLPHAGKHMMNYIAESLHGAVSLMEVEERGIRAFFKYLYENPGFYRLLNEAEFAAPTGHKKHFEQLIEHYTASLKRSRKKGRLRLFDDEQLKAVAYFLMAARSYMYLAYVKYGGSAFPPEYVFTTYLQLIKSSLD